MSDNEEAMRLAEAMDELAAKASDGAGGAQLPWEWTRNPPYEQVSMFLPLGGREIIAEKMTEPNARFVAAARLAVPSLATHVRRLAEENERMRRAMTAARGQLCECMRDGGHVHLRHEFDSILGALTPTPAVEAKPAECGRCGRCGGKRAYQEVGAGPHGHDVERWVNCPDCTTAGGEG